jgi:tetratricopeptide (TPR) repeat protein
VLGSLGHLYFASGVKGKAEEYFTRALQIDPKEVYSLQLRSDLYTENRQYDLALRDLDAIIALPPALVSRQGFVNDRGQFRDMRIAALRSRSELYQMLGRLDEAARDLNAAVAYKREAEPLVARAQFLLSREGRVTEALKDLEAAIALDPGDRYAHYTKGLALMEQKRFGDALQAFDRCLEASQGYDYCLRMRARVHRERGDTDRAVADMENAMKSPRIIAQSITALQVAGYWNSREVPESLTPALRDAVRACMLDKRCN